LEKLKALFVLAAAVASTASCPMSGEKRMKVSRGEERTDQIQAIQDEGRQSVTEIIQLGLDPDSR
jgi:Spy/CpxP family protein refolding chaperone